MREDESGSVPTARRERRARWAGRERCSSHGLWVEPGALDLDLNGGGDEGTEMGVRWRKAGRGEEEEEDGALEVPLFRYWFRFWLGRLTLEECRDGVEKVAVLRMATGTGTGRKGAEIFSDMDGFELLNELTNGNGMRECSVQFDSSTEK